MSTLHDDATSWRDLADQLTPEQVAELEYLEAAGQPPSADLAAGHLNHARAMSRCNIAQALCSDLTPPADAAAATDLSMWLEYDADEYQRSWTAWTHPTGGVFVWGVQGCNGAVTRTVMLAQAADDLTAAGARALACVLVEAADECDRLDESVDTADTLETAWGAYPVNSTTRQCCGGIGDHTAECPECGR